jgi:hypothetical protein
MLVGPALEKTGDMSFCKTTDWSLGSHLLNIQRFATNANASNTPTYPHIIITCKFCAHSIFFNAVQISIAAPPAGQRACDLVTGVDEMEQGSILGLQRSLTDLIKKQDEAASPASAATAARSEPAKIE